jgi:hypothetical protein
MTSCAVQIHIDGSPTIEELHMRIATFFALKEEHHVEAPGTVVVVSPKPFFDDTLREEAEHTEEALIIAVVVPLP